MTNEDIDRMLEQAVREAAPQELYKYPFARIVAAAEREACARVCEEECADPDDQFKNYEDTHTDGWQDGCNSCAWAIRARGEKK